MSDGAQVRQSILRALQEAGGPCGASVLARAVAADGIDLSARAVRAYLLRLDREGLTVTVSRRLGRTLTPRGLEELARANVMEKIGFVAARVDDLGYRMNFDPRSGEGTVVANLALIDETDFHRAAPLMAPVFARRLGMGTRLALARGGETLAGVKIPVGMVGLGTVCSVTVNGILLKRGIPTVSRFGGLVELKGGQPTRFVDLIEYRGTTSDPLELLIQAGRTMVREAAATGAGVVGASLREVPTAALEEVLRVRREMGSRDMPAILAVGRPSRPLLDVPIAEGRTGLLVIAGLNPIAAIHEAGVRVRIASLNGLEDYTRFLPYRDATLRSRRESPLID
jgi:repressor of nif and glnA expression